jgi:hypothetical protein
MKHFVAQHAPNQGDQMNFCEKVAQNVAQPSFVEIIAQLLPWIKEVQIFGLLL